MISLDGVLSLAARRCVLVPAGLRSAVPCASVSVRERSAVRCIFLVGVVHKGRCRRVGKAQTPWGAGGPGRQPHRSCPAPCPAWCLVRCPPWGQAWGQVRCELRKPLHTGPGLGRLGPCIQTTKSTTRTPPVRSRRGAADRRQRSGARWPAPERPGSPIGADPLRDALRRNRSTWLAGSFPDGSLRPEARTHQHPGNPWLPGCLRRTSGRCHQVNRGTGPVRARVFVGSNRPPAR